MKKVVFSVLALLICTSAYGNTQAEIQHLLNYVASTQCMYERNGDMHTGEKAVEHIKKKYDYYEDDIENAEDFIKHAATKSKMSGKHYLIHCPSKPTIKSQTWLHAELVKYRNQ